MSGEGRLRLVLDTHVWLWFLLTSPKLPKRMREVMESDEPELLLSTVSIWEAHLLLERGRLSVRTQSPRRWIERALQRFPVTTAPITTAIALRSRTIDGLHGDPADRFIAATALESKAQLVTVDERLLECPELRCF